MFVIENTKKMKLICPFCYSIMILDIANKRIYESSR